MMDTHHYCSLWHLPSNKKNPAPRLIRSITSISTTLVSTAESLISFILTRTNKAKSNSSNHGEKHLLLPADIMVEIFCRLDAQTLLKLKSVCKQWRASIDDPNFVQEHASRAPLVTHCQDQKAQETFKRITSFDGLILEFKSSNGSQRKYCVRNPTIRRVFDLPDPQQNNAFMGISYAPSSCCYKVFSVHVEQDKTKIAGIEALTLGCVDEPSWRSLDASLLRNYYEHYHLISVMCCKEIVHFYSKRWLGSKDFEIVSLDMDKERFTSTRVPRRFFSDSQTNVCTIGYTDHRNLWYLSLAKIVADELRLLVLEGHKKDKWAEQNITIPLVTFMKMASLVVLPHSMCGS